MNNLLITFFIALGINLLMFIPAYKFKTDKLTDISYSVTFVVVALFGLLSNELSVSNLVLFAMIFIWAFRLGTYLLARIQKMGKDDRFDSMRSSIVKFGSFWVLQGFTVFVVLIPSAFFFNSGFESFSFIAYLGIFLWFSGLILQSLADFQKTTFLSQEKNKGKWVSEGVWKYSQHPNYLGEILVWTGIYLYIIPALTIEFGLIGLISPLFITFLLLFVSGIPLLDKSALKKWGYNADYLTYRRKTGKLLPKHTMALLLSIGLTLLIGMIGGLVTALSVDTWFTEIIKPGWNPPDWIFGPVWTTLYLMMGIAFFLVWVKRKVYSIKFALGNYGLQLLLNMLWSVLFFGLQNPQLAFFEIIVLLAVIVLTTIQFGKISKVAAMLMIPYILWVSFAMVLNFSIWQLN